MFIISIPITYLHCSIVPVIRGKQPFKSFTELELHYPYQSFWTNDERHFDLKPLCNEACWRDTLTHIFTFCLSTKQHYNCSTNCQRNRNTIKFIIRTTLLNSVLNFVNIIAISSRCYSNWLAFIVAFTACCHLFYLATYHKFVVITTAKSVFFKKN